MPQSGQTKRSCDRRARLGDELRRNLKRRKAQERARAAQTDAAADPDTGAGEASADQGPEPGAWKP